MSDLNKMSGAIIKLISLSRNHKVYSVNDRSNMQTSGKTKNYDPPKVKVKNSHQQRLHLQQSINFKLKYLRPEDKLTIPHHNTTDSGECGLYFCNIYINGSTIDNGHNHLPSSYDNNPHVKTYTKLQKIKDCQAEGRVERHRKNLLTRRHVIGLKKRAQMWTEYCAKTLFSWIISMSSPLICAAKKDRTHWVVAPCTDQSRRTRLLCIHKKLASKEGFSASWCMWNSITWMLLDYRLGWKGIVGAIRYKWYRNGWFLMVSFHWMCNREIVVIALGAAEHIA